MSIEEFDEAPRLCAPLIARDHVTGPADAPVTLLEYGDYECGPCRSAQPMVQALRKSFDGRLRFAFRHFPLVDLHPNALLAAEAAEAAGRQGRFWEMHDALMSLRATTPATIVSAAESLDLDLDEIRSAIASGATRAAIRDDVVGGVRSGVGGTPTFFVNGVRWHGLPRYEDFARALETA